MSHPFQHPSAKGLLKRVAQLFQSKKAFILQDSNIVFVCGGPANDGVSMRSRFLAYASAHLPHLRMFLAEDAEKDYVTHDDPEFHNVAEFEELIGAVSECVIIFPESAGSFAELGYFSKSVDLRKKILVAHKADLQSDDSFILRGPIALIDQHSNFKPAVQISYCDPDFKTIKSRLEKRINSTRRKSFTYESYDTLTFREKFFLVLEIVRIFTAITFDGLEYVFKSIFSHANPTDIRHILSILIGAGLVVRVGEDNQFFCLKLSAKTFMQFDGLESETLRLELIDFYDKRAPDIAELVRGLANAA